MDKIGDGEGRDAGESFEQEARVGEEEYLLGEPTGGADLGIKKYEGD